MSGHFTVYGDPDDLSEMAGLAEALGMEAVRERQACYSAEGPPALEVLSLALKQGGPALAAAGAAAWALSSVIGAWLKARAERQVTITRASGEESVTVQAKGYDPEAVSQLLKEAQEVKLHKKR